MEAPRFDGIGFWLSIVDEGEADTLLPPSPDPNAEVSLSMARQYMKFARGAIIQARPFALCPNGHVTRQTATDEATRLSAFTDHEPAGMQEWAVCPTCQSAWIIPKMRAHVCIHCLRRGTECNCETARDWREIPDALHYIDIDALLKSMRSQSPPSACTLATEPLWTAPPPNPVDPFASACRRGGRQELSAPRDVGFVYLAHSAGRGDDALKIGKARHPRNRLKEFRTVMPDTVFIRLFKVPNAGALERALHNYFTGKRIAGEWFSVAERDVLEAVRQLMPMDVPWATFTSIEEATAEGATA